MWFSTFFNSPVCCGLEFRWQGVSRLATGERWRWKNDQLHHADTTAGPFLRRAPPARSVLDFNLCFQHSCFFSFVLFFPSSSLHFLPFLLSRSFFYFSFSCLSSCFLPFGTHMASRQIYHTPSVVLFSSLFSSTPIKWPELPWKCTHFSKLSDDRPWSWNWR